MELIDFSKPTTMCDVLLIVENKKLYCNRAMLSIWSPVFETMFKSNFKEKESSEVNFPDKTYDDIHELLRVIYPPNKPITAANVEKMLEFADEYQMTELTRRCRQFLMTQRGTLEILLLAQRYQFEDVIKRCADHLKHTINSSILSNEAKIKEVNIDTLNAVLIARIKHLESLLDTFKKKVSGACEKFREIKGLPGNFNENLTTCSRHTENVETCQDCMRNVRLIINRLCEEGNELTE
ncbi:unnamed protein product [Brachionus calyciflorus]|uniref:BTB domain-containing protein n=1 Tax=Brachionus calyciflorus TaxID=104777 RepID=A0A813N4Q3_9BILA|nr:unnamed protein product [Brachionus calyciflorus]